jgi:hypothetical protein
MADTQNILDWNVTNWATVVLMGLAGFFVAGVLMKLYQRRQG